jgi:hypothetical protein
MVSSNIRFSDIQNHWTKIFIDGLVKRVVISRFPDRTFRPNTNLTRTQFAAIVSKAFPILDKRSYIPLSTFPPPTGSPPFKQHLKEGLSPAIPTTYLNLKI